MCYSGDPELKQSGSLEVIGQQISGQLWGLRNLSIRGGQIQSSRVADEPGFLSHQAETASFCILAGRHGFGLGYHLTRRKPLSAWQDRKPGSPVDNAERGQIGQRS